jgi:hypothetical protein
MPDITDFIAFARAQQDAWDIDPLYPVLNNLFSSWLTNESERASAVLTYVAFYNAPSAVRFMVDGRPRKDVQYLRGLPTGVERRGLRGGAAMADHLERLEVATKGNPVSWLRRGWGADPQENWRQTRGTLEGIKGNGRWASYKTAEVLQKVLRWNLAPPDMGMDRASGPRDCIDMLWGDHAPVAECERRGRALRSALAKEGIVLDIAEVETVLCDFHSMARGHYYVGYDVALLHDDIAAMPRGQARDLLDAAAVVLPQAYWRPRDRALGRIYRDTGRIVTA